jgi:hypothetical protein
MFSFSRRLQDVLGAYSSPAVSLDCTLNSLNRLFSVEKLLSLHKFPYDCNNIVMDLTNALPGNCSVKTVEHATMEEDVFSMR